MSNDILEKFKNENSSTKPTIEEISQPQTELSVYEKRDLNDTNYVSLSKLTDEELEVIKEISDQKLIISDNNDVLTFGSEIQQSMASFSESMIGDTKAGENNHINELLSSLTEQLNENDLDSLNDNSFFGKFFKKGKMKIDKLKERYVSVNDKISDISKRLEVEKQKLFNDNDNLSKMTEENINLYKELNLYIAACEYKLDEIKKDVLPALECESNTQNQEIMFELRKTQDYYDKLDKKRQDLILTQNICLQLDAQIALVRQTNVVLATKIESSINSAIPIWKTQMALLVNLKNQENAVKTQQAISDTTNKLLKQNASLLHQTTVATAKENQRGVVDVETLKEVQNELYKTCQDVYQISKEGKKKREQNRIELKKMNDELNQSLIEYSKESLNNNFNTSSLKEKTKIGLKFRK